MSVRLLRKTKVIHETHFDGPKDRIMTFACILEAMEFTYEAMTYLQVTYPR